MVGTLLQNRHRNKKRNKASKYAGSPEKAAEVARATTKAVKKTARASIMLKDAAQERRASINSRTGEPGPLSSLRRDLEG